MMPSSWTWPFPAGWGARTPLKNLLKLTLRWRPSFPAVIQTTRVWQIFKNMVLRVWYQNHLNPACWAKCCTKCWRVKKSDCRAIFFAFYNGLKICVYRSMLQQAGSQGILSNNWELRIQDAQRYNEYPWNRQGSRIMQEWLSFQRLKKSKMQRVSLAMPNVTDKVGIF